MRQAQFLPKIPTCLPAPGRLPGFPFCTTELPPSSPAAFVNEERCPLSPVGTGVSPAGTMGQCGSRPCPSKCCCRRVRTRRLILGAPSHGRECKFPTVQRAGSVGSGGRGLQLHTLIVKRGGVTQWPLVLASCFNVWEVFKRPGWDDSHFPLRTLGVLRIKLKGSWQSEGANWLQSTHPWGPGWGGGLGRGGDQAPRTST